MQYVTYRIIPHHTVLNSASRNFQRAMYELFSVRHKPRREGFRIVTQPAPDFHWITQLTAESIAYYVRVPADFATSFRTKFRNHEQWRKSTLEIADDFELFTEENTDLYALKYKRHDMFSLDFRYNEQNTPVRDILNVSNELSGNEAVTIFIRQETVDRGKWKRLVDYAWETWDKGGVPQKAGIDPLRVLRGVANGVVYAMYEVHSLVSDVLTGIERTFFHGGGTRAKTERPVFRNPERAELLVNGDLSAMTKNKRNLPVFKTSIRYAVTAEDEVKRGMLARSVAGAYASLAGDNRLESVKINIRSRRDFTPTIMSVDEIGKLTQLPTAELQTEFAEVMTSNRRVEIELPRVFLDDSGILAGTATDRGVTHNIHVPTENVNLLYTFRAFTGSPRMGKDQAMINFIVESFRKHKIGAIIPDFIDERNKDSDGHWKGMSNAVRDHIEPEHVIDLDFSNTAYSFYLGLQTIFRNVEDPRIAADLVSEYLSDFLLSDGDEDKFQTQEFCREAAKATVGDLQDMKRMFKEQKFRRQKIADLDDILDMDLWRDYDSLSEKSGMMSGRQGQLAAPVIRRIDMLANREYSKPMFCQPNPNPAADLYKWISEGKIVILRIKMPQGAAMPEPVKKIFGYWIVMLTFLIKLSLDGRGAGTILALNEPHQFLSSGLVHFIERIFSEAPKYKLMLVMAFHNFAQFKKYPGFVDILLSSSVNWHLFKNTNQDAYKRLMPYLSQTFADPQQAFEATKAFQYIGVWLDSTGDYAPPFVADALPRVADRYNTLDNAFLTERQIAEYGRPTKEVLADIKRRRTDD
ncbi:hypothetical protein EV294_11247 [Paenibacillus sp. BK033]|uniref:hypothetical protein n=1 Tax=Paenibacillus sp. BK033 TaxID=2512133 RepID=UPI001047ADFB|nr:hypothetical protein [Paenibacillus sp. BK033]TCM89582.1 hypothetical protein EV294_11247 [Paenibacillus sp. BK033]